MRISSICLSLTSPLGAGGFSPASMFRSGQQGFFHNLTIPSGRLYQDFNLTPATALGDAVRIHADELSLNREKVGFLDGTSGCYFSTPDSAAVSITGSLDLRVRVALTDWTPSAAEVICGKWANLQRSFLFFVDTNGTLNFWYSPDGTTERKAASTAAPTVSNGAATYIRATYASGTGAVTFYTSSDGSTWVQLGDVVAITSGTLFDSTAALEIGRSGFNAAYMGGRVYSAQVYSGIAGTLVANFQPSAYTSGATWPAPTTGETWTRNGSAYILGDGYHRVAPSDAARPQLGRQPYGGKRNLFSTDTNTFTTRTFTTGAVEYTLSIYGTGSVTLSGTSTAGPLQGTGANDRVTLTFTPTAGTLTLTVSGTVTNAQIELGASATAYQYVAAAYDTTQSGVNSVYWLYGAGSQYMVVQVSRNLTFLHDGTGGYIGLNAYVNKADDGAEDFFYSSRAASTQVGIGQSIQDSTGNAVLGGRVSNGSANIIQLDSADGAITRFAPLVIADKFATADSPDYTAMLNGALVLSGNATGTPSTAASTQDMNLLARDGANILPGFLGAGYAINDGTNVSQANRWLAQQTGATYA
jgi:hypothetical protein